MVKTRLRSTGKRKITIDADARKRKRKSESESGSEWESADDDDEDDDGEDEDFEMPKRRRNATPRKKAARPQKKATAVRTQKKKNKSVSVAKAPYSAAQHDDSSSEDDEKLLPTSLRKTAKGGYAHTSKSKALIGKANKGNTPWNKGRNRSEADKAKIAAGVRARNRAKLLEKLKKFDMTEEEYYAKSKEIKLLRERVRKMKVAAKKKKERDLANLQSKLDAAVALRDKVKNTDTGPLNKEFIQAIQKQEESKILETLSNNESIVDTNQHLELLTVAECSEKEGTGDKEKPKVYISVNEEDYKSKTNLKPPVPVWKMEWTPQDFDQRNVAREANAEEETKSSYPKCRNAGFGGLICCEECSKSYSKVLQQTVEDMEEQRLEAVVCQAEELLGYVEETRIRLLRSTQVVKQKPPPEHLGKLTAAEVATKNSARKRSNNKSAAVTSSKDAERNAASAMGWAVTSTLDMSPLELKSARI